MLNLFNNGIGPAGAKALAAVLPKCPLTDLDLENNGIGVEGAKALAEVLPKCPLTSVNLLKNNSGEGAAAVIAAAEQNGKIKTLCGIKPDQTEAKFSDQYLKPADAQLLAFDLKFNSALTSLNLYFNNIGDEGGKSIAEVLPKW